MSGGNILHEDESIRFSFRIHSYGKERPTVKWTRRGKERKESPGEKLQSPLFRESNSATVDRIFHRLDITEFCTIIKEEGGKVQEQERKEKGRKHGTYGIEHLVSKGGYDQQ